MVLVFPGDRIRLLSSSPEGKGEEDFEEGEIECGSGAYRDENGIKRASKIGEIYVKDVFEDVLAVDEEDEDEENDEEEKKKKTKKKRKRVVEVLNREEIEDENVRVRLPEVNDVVFAKCTKIREKMAQFDVLVCDGKHLKTEFSGIVRQQDVRKTEIDKVSLSI